MKKRRYDDDDGRTIVDMSMTERPSYNVRGSERAPDPTDVDERENEAPGLTKKETWSVLFGALKAGLLIGLVFVGGAALLILFCIYVWFK